jgi:hypothetical protein
VQWVYFQREGVRRQVVVKKLIVLGGAQRAGLFLRKCWPHGHDQLRDFQPDSIGYFLGFDSPLPILATLREVWGCRIRIHEREEFRTHHLPWHCGLDVNRHCFRMMNSVQIWQL